MKTREECGAKMSENRKISSIWMHFDSCDNIKAQCRICKVKLSYRAGSTNNLNRHLRTVHPAVQLEEKRQASMHFTCFVRCECSNKKIKMSIAVLF